MAGGPTPTTRTNGTFTSVTPLNPQSSEKNFETFNHLLPPRAAWSIIMETEILSDEELAELTGYKARAYQRRWLVDRHWVFVESLSLIHI